MGTILGKDEPAIQKTYDLARTFILMTSAQNVYPYRSDFAGKPGRTAYCLDLHIRRELPKNIDKNALRILRLVGYGPEIYITSPTLAVWSG